MNLLVLSTWYPWPADNGSRLRAYHLLRELAKTFTIDLITGVQDDYAGDREAVLRGDHPQELTGLCRSVQGIPWVWHTGEGGMAPAVRALFDPLPRSVRETPNPALTAAIAAGFARRPDAVLALELAIDHYLPDNFPPQIPVVLEQVEVSGGERTLHSKRGLEYIRLNLTHQKAVRYRRQRFRRYTAVTVVSQEEAEAVTRLCGQERPSVHIIPNGVAVTDYPVRNREQAVPGRLLYNGALSYRINAEAVRWFVRDILPAVVAQVPVAHLVVTGRKDIPAAREFLGHPGVQLTGFVPDLRPVLQESMLSVVPIREGGGTRLKVLEAWAAGLPVVSTTIGASGLEAVQGHHLQLADSAVAFANAVVSLLQNPAQQITLAQQAREFVEARYDWRAIGAKLAALLIALVRKSQP